MKCVTFVLIIAVTFTSSCKEKKKFISNFDNTIFLIACEFLDGNKEIHKDSTVIKTLGTLYNKELKPNVNDTLLYECYWKMKLNTPCKPSNPHLLFRFSSSPKIYSPVINQKQIDSLISCIQRNLENSYADYHNIAHRINIKVNLRLFNCNPFNVNIVSDKKIDSNLLNEIYKSIYLSPQFALSKVPATKEECTNKRYYRSKQVDINFCIKGRQVELVDFLVDSTRDFKFY